VARLEDVLTVKTPHEVEKTAEVAPAPIKVEPAPIETTIAPRTAAAAPVELEPPTEQEVVEEPQRPSSPERPAGGTRYVTAGALRQAFWFEQQSALASDGDVEDVVVEEPRASVPPPGFEAAAPVSPVVPSTEAATSADETRVAQTTQHWLAALCLLALIALIVVLTGRNPRGCTADKTR
jgi:hypothetical protein